MAQVTATFNIVMPNLVMAQWKVHVERLMQDHMINGGIDIQFGVATLEPQFNTGSVLYWSIPVTVKQNQ